RVHGFAARGDSQNRRRPRAEIDPVESAHSSVPLGRKSSVVPAGLGFVCGRFPALTCRAQYFRAFGAGVRCGFLWTVPGTDVPGLILTRLLRWGAFVVVVGGSVVMGSVVEWWVVLC